MTDCVGCGHCCKKAMCMLGVVELGRTELDCPYLYWHVEDNRYYCRIYNRETWLVVFGEGCSSSLNSWRKDVKRRD